MLRKGKVTLMLGGLIYLYLFVWIVLKTKMINNSEIYLQLSSDEENTTNVPVTTNASIHVTEYQHYNIPKWQQKVNRTQGSNQTIYLAIALQVRIYQTDKAKWTLKELKQWMHYVFWSGVGHIYVCDHYKFENETLKTSLKKYIEANLVTYISWSKIRHAMTAQVICYQYIIDKYKDKTKWQMAIDMDEYPYIDYDTKEGFLIRFLETVPEDVSEVSMPNYLMLGQGDRSRDMVIERVTRIKSRTKKSNHLDKPIYRPKFVRAGIHHTSLKKGKVQREYGVRIKNLHYWGARLQNWGPDTNKTFQETESFPEVRDKLGMIIRNSLLSFGETDAFSTETGP